MLIGAASPIILEAVFFMVIGADMHKHELVDFIYAYLQNMKDNNDVVNVVFHICKVYKKHFVEFFGNLQFRGRKIIGAEVASISQHTCNGDHTKTRIARRLYGETTCWGSNYAQILSHEVWVPSVNGGSSLWTDVD